MQLALAPPESAKPTILVWVSAELQLPQVGEPPWEPEEIAVASPMVTRGASNVIAVALVHVLQTRAGAKVMVTPVDGAIE